MFGLRIVLRPTAGLTFRRVPFSTLEMLTYPFVPPTTLSGYLDRLIRLARGDLLPAITNPNDLRFYALPQSYHVLGALAQPAATIISTRRQGIRSFDHVAFSRIQRSKDGENYQLYRWEYLFTETLVGYVLHEEEQALGALLAIQNYGCKLGKEGWAYVEQIEGPFALKEQSARAVPSSIVAAPEAFGGASRIYPLFRYAWREEAGISHELGVGSAPIEGFISFLAATIKTPVDLRYYQGNGASIPVSLLRYF
jgi:hypothetical protein